MKKFLLIALIALATAAPATAGLQLRGQVGPHMRAWVKQAQVPLPNTGVKVVLYSDPMYEPKTKTLYLPGLGDGWTLFDNHVLLYHELGHAFDFANMDAGDRESFKRFVGTTCKWWATNCYSISVSNGDRLRLAPGEMFAEMYAACAFGLTREQLDLRGAVTYGWEPPQGTDAALCALIRGF